MIYIAILLAAGYPIIVVAFLRYLKARDVQDRLERVAANSSHDVQVAALRDEVRAAYASRSDEIATLLQRIQAPEQAVIQHQVETAGPGEAILPLSDEEAAEREQQLRDVIERIEAAENEGVFP